MQPCLMAMEMAEPVDMTMAGEQGHSEHAKQHACPHCPPSSPHADQVSALSADCGELPDLKQGDRTSKLEVDSGWSPALVSVTYVTNLSQPKRVKNYRDGLNSIYPGDPPLNLGHCVVLI